MTDKIREQVLLLETSGSVFPPDFADQIIESLKKMLAVVEAARTLNKIRDLDSDQVWGDDWIRLKPPSMLWTVRD